MNPIEVQVRRLGAATVDVTLQSGQTVADALAAAGVDAGSNSIRVNGAEATLSTALTGDSKILLVPSVKGG